MQLLDTLEHWMTDNTSKRSGVIKYAEANEQNIVILDGLSIFPSAFPPTGTKNKSQQMQTLKALESVTGQTNDLLGWPLMPPYKPTLVKCEKCSRDFCSAINHRRHCRGHRKPLNNNKDSLEKRKLLAAYWDKLSIEEAREILSLEEASIENVSGTSIFKALTSSIKKPGFLLLPHAYVKAGSTLVDMFREGASALPISSEELFSVLDNASEKTFLSCGNASFLQMYLFGGNAVNIALELKNLVSCVSFLIEKELVKAWVAHKEAESLRCEQLLVEEEEAAHKRQAGLLEKKRLKKLRQKEKRVKEPAMYTNTDVIIERNVASDDDAFEPIVHSDHCLYNQEASCQEPNLLEDSRLVENGKELIEAVPSHTEDDYQKVDTLKLGMEQQHSVSGQFLGTEDNFHDNTVSDKTLADDTAVNLLGDLSICSRNMEMKSEEGTNKRDKAQTVEHDNCNKLELLIGSILIILDDDDGAHIKDTIFIGKESLEEKQADAAFSGKIDNQMGVDTVCHDNHQTATVSENTDTKASEPHSDGTVSAEAIVAVKESCHAEEDVVSDEHKDSPSVPISASTLLSEFFSGEAAGEAAKGFLSQRWRETMSSQHATYVSCAETEGNGIK